MSQQESQDRDRVYIRFGDAPADGRSFAGPRRRLDRRERGVSVFTGYPAPDGEGYVIDTSYNPAQTAMFRKLVHAEARVGLRQVYLAEGEEVLAWGCDFEPLLDLRTLKLTPLPPGTLLRESGHWGGYQYLFRAVGFLDGGRTWGPVPDCITKPAPPVRVNLPPELPGGSAPADVPSLIEAVRERSTSYKSPVHGEEHWRRVAFIALTLISLTPGVDPLEVICFAILHDSLRVYEGGDAWHGYRAARLAEELLGGGELLSAEQLEGLVFALENHDLGATASDPTVAVSWDADRLCLWRVGKRPDARLLSTGAACLPGVIEGVRELHTQQRRMPWDRFDPSTWKDRRKYRPHSWEEILQWYAPLVSEAGEA